MQLTYIEMYRSLPKESRAYIRAVKYPCKEEQAIIRMMRIEWEYREFKAMLEAEYVSE